MNYKIKIISLVILLTIAACTNSSSYNSNILLKDIKDQKEFIKRLENSGLDYKVTKNGMVHYHSKDKVKIITIAFNYRNNTCPTPKNTISWKVSLNDAKNIILAKYPNILKSSKMLCPTSSIINANLDGFTKKGEEVWNIRVHCNNHTANALFFVHPVSGDIFVIKKPYENGKSNCSQ